MGCTGSRGGKGSESEYNKFDLSVWLGGAATVWAPPFDGGVDPYKDAFSSHFADPGLSAASSALAGGQAGRDNAEGSPLLLHPGGGAPRNAGAGEADALDPAAPRTTTTGCNPGTVWLLLWPGRRRRTSGAAVEGTASRRSAARRHQSSGQWQWLEDLLGTIASGDAAGLAVDLVQKQPGTPLFVVAGACPNAFCGMQAVVYCKVGSAVDFWWIKPQIEDPAKLEQNTLNLHMQGRHKNVAESSKAVYGPLAEKFGGNVEEDGLTYGVTSCGRAYIDEVQDGRTTRMFVHLVWQETWSGFFSTSMYMTGKMYYQKAAVGALPLQGPRAQFFARHFRIQDRGLLLAPLDEHPEELVPYAFPPEIATKGE